MDHTKITRNSAIDGYIGQFDNEIELIDVESLYHKLQLDCSVFPVGPRVTVLASGRYLTVIHFTTIDGNIGVLDTEINMTGMKSLEETKVDNIRLQVSFFVSPDGPSMNVLACVNEIDMFGRESSSSFLTVPM